MISEEQLQDVLDATDIVKFIANYVPLEKAGSLYKARCPIHHGNTPTLMVNPHRQVFHCFTCGAGGSVIRFLMDYKQLSFKEAFHELALATENFSPSGQEETTNKLERTK